MSPLTDLSARPRLRWRFAGACFDEASQLLTVADRPVDLERRPLQLLALLLAHAGEIVTKDEILEALWPGREVSEASLTACMTRLRQALGEVGHSAIRTVHGYGYRFDAPFTVEATSPAPPAAAALTTLAEGDPVPHRPNWRLAQRLGTGGYGDAWLAEQTQSHERRVIKFAHDADGLSALRREVALSRLLREGLGPRPDLIRILDWNFAEPPAFIETVWAEQGNLADWAARQGGAAALPLDLRLALAAGIAEALAAIHSMSVLHKDLKPANVLMRTDESGPAIILTDFGSGRALDPSRLDAFGITRPEPDPTQVDSSGGTHMYRAPESFAGGAPTVQADVFALGVILFQLVTGDLRRPLAAGWESLIADPLLREDIAAAAAGDPARRLADAGELAARLRALPERRAARARAEAAAAEAARTRRALELARARRAPLLALLGALLLGFAITTTLYIRAEHAQARAETQAARAKAVTHFLTDDLFSAANPLLGADPNVPVRRVLDVAAADLDRRFPPGSPDHATIEAALGSAYAGLADRDHALPLLRAALAALRVQLGEDDPQTQAVRLAMATLAEHSFDYAAMRQVGLDMLAAHPRDASIELSARYYVIAAACGLSGNYGTCAAQMQPLLAEISRRLGPRHPLTLQVEGDLAMDLGDQQHVAQAIALARETVALTQQVYGPDHFLVQQRKFDLATVLRLAGQYDEAISIMIDVRRRLLSITGTESYLSARVANQLGMAYAHLHRYPEALQSLQIGLDYSVRASGGTSVLAVAAMGNIASTLAAMGRTKDAIAMAQKAYNLDARTSGVDQASTLWHENNLAIDYFQDGNLPKSEALFRDIVGRGRRVFTHGEYDLAQFEFRLAETLSHEGKTEEARALLNESIPTLMKALGPADSHTLRAQALLASLPRAH